MARILLTLSAYLVLFSACKKAESPVTAEDDLRSGTWRRTSGRVTFKDPDTRGDSTLNYLEEELKCRLDNSLQFKDNFTGVMNLGGDRCTEAEPDTKAFTWQITKDEKKISLYGVEDYFPANNVDADILTRTLGYLTIRYRIIEIDPAFQTADTLIFTDVLRRN